MAVDPQQSFPDLEQAVLRRWRERDVFRESLRRRQGAEPWVFYEGPPTANGPPAAHHVLSRVFKDIFPRFKTMRGHLVEGLFPEHTQRVGQAFAMLDDDEKRFLAEVCRKLAA